MVVLVEDANGRLDWSDHTTVTLSVASGPGKLGGTVSVKAVHGVAIFTHLILTTDTLTATDGSDTSALSHPFTVLPLEKKRHRW